MIPMAQVVPLMASQVLSRNTLAPVPVRNTLVVNLQVGLGLGRTMTMIPMVQVGLTSQALGGLGRNIPVLAKNLAQVGLVRIMQVGQIPQVGLVSMMKLLEAGLASMMNLKPRARNTLALDLVRNLARNPLALDRIVALATWCKLVWC
jgi:hypothetical protein